MISNNRRKLLSKLDKCLKIVDIITDDIVQDDDLVDNNNYAVVLKYISDVYDKIVYIYDILEKD